MLREWPDAERALRAVEQADGLLDDEPVAEAHQLLRELVGQDFDIDDDGVPRLHRGTASGRIISTVDTEMRHGRESSSRAGCDGECPQGLCKAGANGASCLQHNRRSHSSELVLIRTAPAASRQASRWRPL